MFKTNFTNDSDELQSFEFVPECPIPSSGVIGRKSTENQSSSKTRVVQSPKMPNNVEDKVGVIPFFRAFVLAKGTIYYQFSSGGRYSKVAYRLIISNTSYDQLEVTGVQQYFYLSATGNNVAHVMSSLKLGRAYECYNIKYYKINEEIKIGNWKQGAYCNEIENLIPSSPEFRSVDNFGSSNTVKGLVVDVCVASFCNCAVLIGPSNGQQYISACRKCNGSGITLLSDNGEEEQRDGSEGLLTLVNIITSDAQVPVQLLVHSNHTESKLDDIVIDVGAVVEVSSSRMLNSRNLSVIWELTGFKAMDGTVVMAKVGDKKEDDKEGELKDVSGEKFVGEFKSEVE